MRLGTTPFPMFVIRVLVYVMMLGGGGEVGLDMRRAKDFIGYINYIVIRLDTINYVALALYFIQVLPLKSYIKVK